MTEDSTVASIAERTYELLSAGAEAELNFLKLERKAEKRLGDARAAFAKDERRLQRAQQRLERGRELVTAAEVNLREAQARRGAGSGHDHT